MVRTKNVEFLATVELPATSSVSSSCTLNDARAFVATELAISVKGILLLLLMMNRMCKKYGSYN